MLQLQKNQLRKWLLITSAVLLPVTAMRAQCSSYPTLTFQSPTLQSGSSNSIGAVYKFTGVRTGTDAYVTIMQRKNASVRTFDDDGTAYIRAWQPIIRVTSSSSVPAWVKFKIEFRKTSGVPDTLACLAMGVVDCDGTSSFQERISSMNQSGYSNSSSTGVSFSTDSFFNVNGDNITYSSIDTTAIDAMAQVNYANSHTIIVKIGAIGVCSNQDRQNCLYFQQFATLTQQSLPVLYDYMNANVSGPKVTLDWSTTAETNNDRFDIERSSNGEDFVKVGEVEGHGNNSTINEYQFEDNVPEGIYYYRLKQVDYNGTYHLSSVMVAHVGIRKITNVAVSPNPVEDLCNMTFYAPFRENVSVTITNSYGQIMRTSDYTTAKGDNNIDVDFATLPSGLYFIELRTNADTVVNRIVKP